MVRTQPGIYLFIGADSPSKDTKLKALKDEFLAKDTRDFNFDQFYAKDVQLADLQERILSFPLKSGKRIIVLKEAQKLSSAVKDFIAAYARKPHPSIILVLDMEAVNQKDVFTNQIMRYVQVVRFKDRPVIDTFMLSRAIDVGKTAHALGILAALLQEGEKPERILGGLRFVAERYSKSPAQLKRKIKTLLLCDIDIKTGKLKPEFALEKLVVTLCSFFKPL